MAGRYHRRFNAACKLLVIDQTRDSREAELHKDQDPQTGRVRDQARTSTQRLKNLEQLNLLMKVVQALKVKLRMKKRKKSARLS